MPKLRPPVLSLLLCLCLSGPAFADYEVELIVFERPALSLPDEAQGDAQGDAEIAPAPPREVYEPPENASDLPTTHPLAALAPFPPKLIEQGFTVLAQWRWEQPARSFLGAPQYRLPIPDLSESYLRIYRTTPIFADLILAMPGEADPFDTNPSADPPPPMTIINEKRRVRFQRIHYFDHPKYGALLVVNSLQE